MSKPANEVANGAAGGAAGGVARCEGFEHLLLSQQLCFALHSTTLAMGRLYQRLLTPLGLTYTQYLVMLVLWERGEASVKALGEALFLDSGTLTPLLKRLEQAGLVDRRRDTLDERRVLVALTEKGLALREPAREVPAQVFAACMAADVPLSRLKGDLEALRGALLRVPADPVSDDPAPARAQGSVRGSCSSGQEG